MYKRILVPTDGSPTAQKGLMEATALAKILQAEIEVLYVVDNRVVYADFSGVSNFGDLLEALKVAGNEILQRAKNDVEKQGVKVSTKLIELANAVVAEVILQEVKDWKADLIVMGTHGRRGLKHLVMGSDAEAVVRSSDAPVLLVRCPDGVA